MNQSAQDELDRRDAIDHGDYSSVVTEQPEPPESAPETTPTSEHAAHAHKAAAKKARATSRREYRDAAYRAALSYVRENVVPCAYCLRARATTVDHHQPLALGGGNEPDNLLPACAPCNFGRGARLGAALRRARRQERRRTIYEPWP